MWSQYIYELLILLRHLLTLHQGGYTMLHRLKSQHHFNFETREGSLLYNHNMTEKHNRTQNVL